MTAEQFTYWLQGFFELSGTTTLNEQQVKILKEHIALVLNKVTPSYEVTAVASETQISPDKPAETEQQNNKWFKKTPNKYC